MPEIAEGSARPDSSTRSSPIAARHGTIARATLGILILGMAWRVLRYATGQPLWGDEAFLAVNVLTRDFRGLLAPLRYHQIAPIGFLWAELAAVRILGPSERALRMIPWLAGLASLALFARFALRAVDRRSALFAVGILAASYYPVRHSAEVKPYATDLLASLVVTALAWNVQLSPKSPRRWLALSFATGLGVWFSYPLAFVAAGAWLVLAARVSRDRTGGMIAGLLGYGVVLAASWTALYALVERSQAASAPLYVQMKTWRGAFPPLSRPWMLPGWLLDVHTGNMLAYPNGGNDFGSTATAILVGFGILALGRYRPWLVALLLAPLGPTLVASAFRLYPYGTSARTTLYMAPAFCLLAGVGLVELIRRARPIGRRRRLFGLAWVALAAMIGVATATNLIYPYKNYEDTLNRDAIRRLAQLARPGDRWLAYDGLPEVPESPGTLLEHWLQQMAEVRYAVLALGPVPATWDPSDAEVAEVNPGRTWLIVHRSGCPKFDDVRLASIIAELTGRLGRPLVRSIGLTRGERLDISEFGPPGR